VLFLGVSFLMGGCLMSYADDLRKKDDLRASSIEKSGLTAMVVAAVLTIGRFAIWIVWD